MKVAICQSCGSIAQKQGNIILNGSDNLFSCPVCKGIWQEISQDSLPVQLEIISKKRFATLQKETKESIATTKEQAEA
jgi:hypothetical protein